MKTQGFTLIEAVVAITIITVGIGAAFLLIGKTTTSIEGVGRRFEASYLAQEGVELTRNIRDKNFLEIRQKGIDPDFGGVNPDIWSNGLLGCTAGDGGCQIDYNDVAFTPYNAAQKLNWNGAGGYSYDNGTPTSFTRKITLTPVSFGGELEKIEVNSEVFWQEGSITRSVAASFELYKWIQIPPPYRFNGRTESATSSSVTIKLDTDITGTCRYSESPTVRYDVMDASTAFTVAANGDGTFTHTKSISTFSGGALLPETTYTFYVRCIGTGNEYNRNPSDFLIEATTAPAA